MIVTTWSFKVIRFLFIAVTPFLWTINIRSVESATNNIVLIEKAGQVSVSSNGINENEMVEINTNTIPFPINPGDYVKVGSNSSATIEWEKEHERLRISSRTIVKIDKNVGEIVLIRGSPNGLTYLNGIGNPGPKISIGASGGTIAAGKLTEYSFAAEGSATSNKVTVSVIDGEVIVTSPTHTFIDIVSGEQYEIDSNGQIRKTSGFNENELIRWCFYYPAILDVNDLKLGEAQEITRLKKSLDAYQLGDVRGALAAYPEDVVEHSSAAQIYHAALLLAAGQVDRTLVLLKSADGGDDLDGDLKRLTNAINMLVKVVKREPFQTQTNALLTTEFMANSYNEQARGGDVHLKASLDYALRAAKKSPTNGLAWERVAELYLCFGRIKDAQSALDNSTNYAPLNAQAAALEGFLLTATNRTDEAIKMFSHAIELDSSLGNAWLGRGLCYFRRAHNGDNEKGLEDLQMAVVLEPQGALPRSYLAKALLEISPTNSEAINNALRRAKSLDPDPTPWLYAGLIDQRMNLPNRAIEDLQKSKELNDNLAIFRSRQLLDQDLAVRSANLASIYGNEGLDYMAVREGANAIVAGYTDYSTHEYLANYFQDLRDPAYRNFRYETPWLSEWIMANLLAPAAAGTLAGSLSQQEYSPLLQQNGVLSSLGLISGLNARSLVQYSSHGDWRTDGLVSATYPNFDMASDFSQIGLRGYAPNTKVSQSQYDARAKLQMGPNDSALLYVLGINRNAGDTSQFDDPNFADPAFHTHLVLYPNIFAGWHHEWNPDNHTLFGAAWLWGRQASTDGDAGIQGTVYALTANGPANVVVNDSVHNTWNGLSVELQQVMNIDLKSSSFNNHTFVFGTRFQDSHITAVSETLFNGTSLESSVAHPSLWVSGYAYDFISVNEALRLIAGASFEFSSSPDNWDRPPVLDSERTVKQWSPKVGFSWQITTNTQAQGMFARSLGGTTYETSVRMEPSQLLGFPQIDRAALPDIIQPYFGSQMQFWGLAVTHRFPPQTYVSVELSGADTKAHGAFGSVNAIGTVSPIQLAEAYDYQQTALTLRGDQLVGDGAVVGLSYRASQARFKDSVPQVSSSAPTASCILQTVDIHSTYTNPRGWFVGANAVWYAQESDGVDGLPGDTFWQFNLHAGYKPSRLNIRFQVDLLNIANQDYRLNSLNIYPYLPRDRTLLLTFRGSF